LPATSFELNTGFLTFFFGFSTSLGVAGFFYYLLGVFGTIFSDFFLLSASFLDAVEVLLPILAVFSSF